MGDDAINLRDQVAVVRRRWKIVVLCALLGLAAALALSFTQKPLYQSAATVELKPIDSSQVATNGQVLQPAEISTQVQIMLSTPVANKVISSLDLDTTPEALLKTISVETVADTRVITVRALRPNAAEAQAVADAFAEEYLTLQQDQAKAQSEETIAALEDRITEIKNRLSTISDKLLTATDSRAEILTSEQQALNLELIQVFGDRTVALANSPSALGNGGQVLTPAPLPTRPAEPKPVKSGVLGLFIGLIVGIGLAFLRDHFDDRVRDESRLRDAISPRPVLGRIPHWGNAKSGRLATVLDPASQVSEAYRALSTSIRFMLAVSGDNPTSVEVPMTPARQLTKASSPQQNRTTGKVLLVTSPMEEEGKTSLSSNLAVVAARFGLKVILVDADLRNPQIASVFGLGRPPGLSDLLANHDRHHDYIIEVEDLRVLPGGSLAPNPAELLASPRMQELLARLAAEADLIIVDTTPVTRVSDGLELVPDADLVLLVARHGQTRFRVLHEAVDKIRQVGGEVSGVVYTDVPTRSGVDPYGYGHSYTGEASNEIAPYRDSAARSAAKKPAPNTDDTSDTSNRGGQNGPAGSDGPHGKDEPDSRDRGESDRKPDPSDRASDGDRDGDREREPEPTHPIRTSQSPSKPRISKASR